VKTLALVALAGLVAPQSLGAQGLREVPQRFVFVQPLGLALGIGTAGVEFTLGRTTTLEIAGVGVYSQEDGVRIYGGGPGIGLRQYFGLAEVGGVVVGARVDGVWLEADNSNATRGFLASGFMAERNSHMYLGLGGLAGFRWVSTRGWFVEPSVGYEHFFGPDPLVPGSQDLQDTLGLLVNLAFGVAW
jgi:hypothetical protein